MLLILSIILPFKPFVCFQHLGPDKNQYFEYSISENKIYVVNVMGEIKDVLICAVDCYKIGIRLA